MNRDESGHSDDRDADSEAASEDEPSASRDLADGLDLMIRAARRAMRGFDRGKLEDLGRRAVQSVEDLDPGRVGELGRKAARKLDPRKIEEVAQEAGRELMNVIERVSDRIDSMVSGSRRGRDEDDEPRTRIRVDDDDRH